MKNIPLLVACRLDVGVCYGSSCVLVIVLIDHVFWPPWVFSKHPLASRLPSCRWCLSGSSCVLVSVSIYILFWSLLIFIKKLIPLLVACRLVVDVSFGSSCVLVLGQILCAGRLWMFMKTSPCQSPVVQSLVSVSVVLVFWCLSRQMLCSDRLGFSSNKSHCQSHAVQSLVSVLVALVFDYLHRSCVVVAVDFIKTSPCQSPAVQSSGSVPVALVNWQLF